MKVEDVMNKAMVVDPVISVKQAAKIMSDKNIGCLLVLDKNKVAGIITERDVTRNITQLGSKISKIMSKKVITVEASENLENAALIMGENKIKKLPVIDNGKLVGIMTATDVVANADILNEDFFFD